MIRWILLDQAKVQTHNVFSTEKYYTINGKKFDAEILESIFRTKEYDDFERGKVEENIFIEDFVRTKGLDLSIQEYKELIKRGIKPIEGMRRLLVELDQKYSLATLTNEGVAWAQCKMDVSGFRKFFKEFIISGDLGISKPDKDFYLKALDIIRAEPGECIFIDDKKINCKIAEELRIKSIIFRNPQQLREELIKLDLL